MPVGTTTHVALGGHEYLIRQASYIKRQAPQFGARFTTGDPDFNTLTMWQHWAQRCFIGGVGQDEFADDAMYDEGVGVNTTDHEKVTLSRDLARGAGSNWAISSGSTNASGGYRACVYNNKLYVLTIPDAGVLGYLWEFDPSTDGWTRITALDGRNIAARSIGTFDGKLFVGGLATTGGPRVAYSSGSLTSWTTVTNPAGVVSGVYSMRAFQRKLYVCYGTQVWRMKEDQTWDGNTVFYKADQNSDSNYIISMETHLGFLYMLSRNGHVHRTDGNSTFDIWSWDGQTNGVAIKSFDGRLFILTFEYGFTTDVGYGVLYQMSGSAVTQLKRWGDENAATVIGSMMVFNRHLFYGASNLLGFGGRAGFGIAIYDPIEDAHSILASNSDTVTYARGSAPYSNYIVDDVIAFSGRLYAFVRGHGAFITPYKPPRDIASSLGRFDISAAGGSLASTNGGWFTTSTYDAGTPGVDKLWRKVIVDATVPTNTGIFIEHSSNNGTSWTTTGSISVAAARKKYEFWINVKSTSLKLRVTLRSTSATATPTFYGYVVSYIMVPEPNWLWTFTIVLSEKQLLMDGTTATVDTEAEIAFLSNLHRTKELTTFTDLDGVQWAAGGLNGVLVYDIEFRILDYTQPLEGEVVVTLLEAVEDY